MKTFYKKVLLYIFPAIAVLVLSACSKDNTPVEPDEQNDYTNIIAGFADNVALSTYGDLDTKAGALNAAATAYLNTPTQENLNAACEAWKATRAPWESSEAFLFGPVEYLSLDPSMDSWPLDKAQLDEILKSNYELTPEFIKDGLGPTLRGFHTLEYLLFSDGQPRNTADITNREKQYLAAAAQVLADDAHSLHTSWSESFAAEFKNAGKSGSRYNSQVQAVQEMIEGMIGIADEVGNGKISDPYKSKDVLSVESWYSWNSLTDFQNNIRSIENAYTGKYQNGTSTAGLSDFIKAKNPELDTKVKTEITAAITAIDAIPHPFRNNLNANAQIDAAVKACNILMTTLNSEVKAIITN